MQMLSSLLPCIREVVRHAPHATVNAMQLSSAGTMSRCASWSSPTHTPRDSGSTARPGVAEQLSAAEVILHAGDVCVASVLEELSAYAPLHAVLGNNDGPDVSAWGASETAELDLAGLRIGMIHDAGPRQGRLARLRRRFPGTDLVLFGHSHIPLQAVDGNFRIFNPGSPTDKRRQPHRTLGVLEIEYGHLTRAEIVTLP